LEAILNNEKDKESDYAQSARWLLQHTRSSINQETILSRAISGDDSAIYELGAFPSEETLSFLISVIYEKPKANGNISRQGAAVSALASMPKISVPWLLKILESENGYPFNFARETMHKIYQDKMDRIYRSWEPTEWWFHRIRYPDIQYAKGPSGPIMVFSRDSKDHAKIAAIWREWWAKQSASGKTQ